MSFQQHRNSVKIRGRCSVVSYTSIRELVRHVRPQLSLSYFSLLPSLPIPLNKPIPFDLIFYICKVTHSFPVHSFYSIPIALVFCLKLPLLSSSFPLPFLPLKKHIYPLPSYVYIFSVTHSFPVHPFYSTPIAFVFVLISMLSSLPPLPFPPTELISLPPILSNLQSHSFIVHSFYSTSIALVFCLNLSMLSSSFLSLSPQTYILVPFLFILSDWHPSNLY